MKAFVIAFILTISNNGQNDDIIVQFGGPGFFFDKLSECNEMLSEYGPVNIVEEFLGGLEAVIALDVNMYPHCTPYDTYHRTFPDYPEFDIPAHNLPPEIGL